MPATPVWLKALGLFIAAVSADAALAQSIFVPLSAATPQEVAGARDRLKAAGLKDDEIEQEIRAGYGSFTYREATLRAAFPSVRPTDRQLSVCGNSMKGGKTQVVFVSEPFASEIHVKTASCGAWGIGLWCEAMTERSAYFLESPEHFFFLEGVTFEEARTVLLEFEKHVLPELTDWFAGWELKDVTEVAETPEGYRVTFGELYCRGCTAKVTVRFERRGDDQRLVLVGQPQALCI